MGLRLSSQFYFRLEQSVRTVCVASGIQQQHSKTSRTNPVSVSGNIVASIIINKASRGISSHLSKQLRNKHMNSRAKILTVGSSYTDVQNWQWVTKK